MDRATGSVGRKCRYLLPESWLRRYGVLSGTVPLHTGLVTRKDEAWTSGEGAAATRTEGYAYDHAGRLSKESISGNITGYSYDYRGNILSVTGGTSPGTYAHDGYRLTSAQVPQTASFTHDALGRMTYDGLTGQSTAYNDLDLVGNISRNGTTLANYSYLSDGTKLEAVDGGGEGLVDRGPFVYRKSPYAFCNNNPVNFVDPDGKFPDMFWDIASVGFGVHSLIGNIQSGNVRGAIGDGIGIVVDVAAAALPFIPGGVGILRTGNRVLNIADAGIDALKLGDELSSFSHAAEFGVDSYKNLKKSVEATYGTGSGLEVHHLIEKRFAKQMGMKEADMPSIVLTKDEHKQFTAAWREAIGYDKSGAEMFTSGVEKEQILNVAQDIYKDYPELLKSIEEIFK